MHRTTDRPVRRPGRRGGRRLVAVAAIVVLAGALGACSDDDSDTATGGGEATTPRLTAPTTAEGSGSTATTEGSTASTEGGATSSTGGATTTEAAGLTQRCQNPGGFSVGYPEGWSTNTEPAPEPCVWFAPIPIEVPAEPTDSLLGPINVRVQEGVALADMSQPDRMFEEIVSTEEVTVAGRPAVRIESVATGEGLLNEGTQILAYGVELSPAADGTPRVLTATAIGCCQVPFDDSAALLEQMVASLEITT